MNKIRKVIDLISEVRVNANLTDAEASKLMSAIVILDGLEQPSELAPDEWEKLDPKEKLLAVGHTEEILQSLVKNEEDFKLHNENFEEELSLCAENQA